MRLQNPEGRVNAWRMTCAQSGSGVTATPGRIRLMRLLAGSNASNAAHRRV